MASGLTVSHRDRPDVVPPKGHVGKLVGGVQSRPPPRVPCPKTDLVSFAPGRALPLRGQQQAGRAGRAGPGPASLCRTRTKAISAQRAGQSGKTKQGRKFSRPANATRTGAGAVTWPGGRTQNQSPHQPLRACWGPANMLPATARQPGPTGYSWEGHTGSLTTQAAHQGASVPRALGPHSSVRGTALDSGHTSSRHRGAVSGQAEARLSPP